MTTVNKNLAMVLIAVVAVSTGGVLAFTENAQPLQTPTSQKELPVVLGHIELVAKDSQGNIIAYRQTDNLVVSQGLNSTINKLFGAGLQPNTCGACTAPGLFNYVGVGTGSTVLYTDTITTFATTQRGNHVLGTVAAISSGGGTGMGAQIVGNWAANRLQNGSGTAERARSRAGYEPIGGASPRGSAAERRPPGLDVARTPVTARHGDGECATMG